MDEEENILKVLGAKGREKKDYVKNLSIAVVKVFHRYKLVRMKCIGAAAVNHAEKAYILAAESLEEDVELVQKSYFFSTKFDDSEKTGIIKEIFAR